MWGGPKAPARAISKSEVHQPRDAGLKAGADRGEGTPAKPANRLEAGAIKSGWL